MRIRVTFVAVLAALAFLGRSSAQEPPIRDAAPTQTAAPSTELADMKAELSSLRAEVAKLQQTLDVFLNKTVSDLRSENERLRQEVKRLYRDGGLTLPDVPMPDRALLESAVAESGQEVAPPPERPGDEGVAKDSAKKKAKAAREPKTGETAEGRVTPGGELAYDVVAEWGRSPEEAAAMAKSDPKASSLKGMTCVVTKNTDDASLIAMARSLREQCDAFDNINIEVFDDEVAARAYEENRAVAPQHRVLSISKHKASGRDVILLIKGEKAQQVPPKP